MALRQTLRQVGWALGVVIVMTTLPVSVPAQWQGPHKQQLSPPPSPPQTSSTPPTQERPPVGGQPHPEGHPQVKELPPAQSPAAMVPQPTPPSGQSVVTAPQTAGTSPQSLPVTPPSLPVTPPLATLPAIPAYLGVIGESAPGCRYPAGVRVTHVVRDSPAYRAGLKGEWSLTWTEAAGSGVALSSAAPLGSQSLAIGDHQSWSSDLILAIDGKRIHKKEELEQELRQCRPGDIVYLSVLRGDDPRPLQMPITLTDYPATPPATQTANAPPPAPGS